MSHDDVHDDPGLFREALDALDEGIQVLSPDWRYLYVNLAVERHGRKPRAALLGRTMHECYPGIEKTPMFARLEQCMRERRPLQFENEFTFEDGRRGWFELRARPRVGGIVVISVDVTERRRARDELRTAHEQALHDLATPVVRVREGVLLVPLVGAFDAVRSQRIAETLLARVVDDRAKIVILDVSGIPALGTEVANHLLQATAMLRLLGSRAVLTGVSAPAAQAITGLGVDLSALLTMRELAEGVEWAVAAMSEPQPGG